MEQFEVETQLKVGVRDAAVSESAAPALFVETKGEKIRFCVDYRQLNGFKIRDTYPLPRIDECNDAIGKAEILTALDVYSSYCEMNRQ